MLSASMRSCLRKQVNFLRSDKDDNNMCRTSQIVSSEAKNQTFSHQLHILNSHELVNHF